MHYTCKGNIKSQMYDQRWGDKTEASYEAARINSRGVNCYIIALLKTISYHSPRLPNELLNNPHLCAGEQACGGCVSRPFEGTEEAFGDFQFTAEEARGGVVCLVGIVTLGEGAEVLERHGEG